jgi:hypothetical protein
LNTSVTLAARPQQLGVFFQERETLVLDIGRRNDLAVEFLQLGFVVEQLELARPARHEQKNDALGLGREMRRQQGQWVCPPIEHRRVRRNGLVAAQQRSQGQRADRHAAL